MSDCCTTKNKSPRQKRACPDCQSMASGVKLKTMLHHLSEPWARNLDQSGYYFCPNPLCDVVYFSSDGDMIYQSAVRTEVGIKQQSGLALACYCFGINKDQAATCKQAKDFVIQQTRLANCSCETANPSGKCCLKNFP